MRSSWWLAAGFCAAGSCVAGCGSDGTTLAAQAATPRTEAQVQSAAPSAPTQAVDAGSTEAALAGSCPGGFEPKEGLNTMPVGDGVRQFHLALPEQSTGPRPLFVALTGTVQEELAFLAQSGLSELPESGWIVVAPVRSCSQEKRNCSTVGQDGRVWEPWYDGTMPRSDDPGPDVAFVDAMVRCVAAKWHVAADKIYAGGISAGGSFTNRNLTFNSELFAGGVPASGNWSYGVPPATPRTMEASIVIVIWGGPNDTWPPSPPYAAETKATSAFYAAQPNVVTISCSGTHGHRWPTAYTPWLAETLLSHPKGSDPRAFVLKPPPEGLSCVVGPYTDH